MSWQQYYSEEELESMDGFTQIHNDEMYCAYGEEYFEENGGRIYEEDENKEEEE
jgi:hypothetical protein